MLNLSMLWLNEMNPGAWMLVAGCWEANIHSSLGTSSHKNYLEKFGVQVKVSTAFFWKVAANDFFLLYFV